MKLLRLRPGGRIVIVISIISDSSDMNSIGLHRFAFPGRVNFSSQIPEAEFLAIHDGSFETAPTLADVSALITESSPKLQKAISNHAS